MFKTFNKIIFSKKTRANYLLTYTYTHQKNSKYFNL